MRLPSFCDHVRNNVEAKLWERERETERGERETEREREGERDIEREREVNNLKLSFILYTSRKFPFM